jgi:hypothetical protein
MRIVRQSPVPLLKELVERANVPARVPKFLRIVAIGLSPPQLYVPWIVLLLGPAQDAGDERCFHVPPKRGRIVAVLRSSRLLLSSCRRIGLLGGVEQLLIGAGSAPLPGFPSFASCSGHSGATLDGACGNTGKPQSSSAASHVYSGGKYISSPRG